jgi:hypothetical protein
MMLILGFGGATKENVPYDSVSRMCDLESMAWIQNSKPNSIIGMSRRMAVMLAGHLAP